MDWVDELLIILLLGLFGIPTLVLLIVVGFLLWGR